MFDRAYPRRHSEADGVPPGWRKVLRVPLLKVQFALLAAIGVAAVLALHPSVAPTFGATGFRGVTACLSAVELWYFWRTVRMTRLGMVGGLHVMRFTGLAPSEVPRRPRSLRLLAEQEFRARCGDGCLALAVEGWNVGRSRAALRLTSATSAVVSINLLLLSRPWGYLLFFVSWATILPDRILKRRRQPIQERLLPMMSEAVGTPLSTPIVPASSPFASAQDYDAWCARLGLAAYAFGLRARDL
jgi:hypothetical protein